MKKPDNKKPSQFKIWSLRRREKLAEINLIIDNSTPEVAKYVKKVCLELEKEYQKWFDVAFLIYSRAQVMREKDREEYLSEFACKDVVKNLLEGKDYSKLIWKKLKPKKVKDLSI